MEEKSEIIAQPSSPTNRPNTPRSRSVSPTNKPDVLDMLREIMETIQRQRMETEALKEEIGIQISATQQSVDTMRVEVRNLQERPLSEHRNENEYQEVPAPRQPEARFPSPFIPDIYDYDEEEEINVSFRNFEDQINSSNILGRNIGRRPRGFQLPTQAPIPVPAPAFTEPNRRQTIMQRLDRLNNTPDTNIRVYKNTPSYDYLALTKLDIEHVIEFISGIDLYQSKHNLSVPAAVLIPNGIRDRLLTYSTDSRLNHQNFYALNNLPLIQLMQKALRPTDVIDFTKKLEKNIRFELPSGYRPSVTNFMPFHQGMLMYRQLFTRIFEFLSEGNDKYNIPKADDKEGGSINIFLSKIPFRIGQRMYRNLNQRRFDDIFIFLEVYYNQLKTLFDKSIESRTLNNILYDPSTSANEKQSQSDRALTR